MRALHPAFAPWLLVLGSAMLSPPARAQERVRVAVDWSGVSDADIERCGIGRLRAATIERLVAEGHAVVEEAGVDGIRVVVSSAPGGLRVRCSSAWAEREQLVPAGEACDATFTLEVTAKTAELVAAVQDVRPPPPPPASRPADTAGTAAAPVPREHTWDALIDLGVRLPTSLDWLLAGGLGARFSLAPALGAGVRVELGVHPDDQVSVIEGRACLFGAYRTHEVGPYVELGAILHFARSDVRSVTKVDIEAAAGVEIALGWLRLHGLIYGRARRFEHRVAGEIIQDTGNLGVMLRLGAQPFGS